MLSDAMARGGGLTTQEEDQLQLYLSPMDIVRNWIKMGAGFPSFRHFETQTAEFVFMPNAASHLSRTTAQSIGDGAGNATSIQWENFTQNDSSTAFDPLDAASVVFVGNHKDRIFAIMFYCEWAQHDTGFREARILQYDADSGILETNIITNQDATTGRPTNMSGIEPMIVLDQARFMRVLMTQTSGDALDLNKAELLLFRVF